MEDVGAFAAVLSSLGLVWLPECSPERVTCDLPRKVNLDSVRQDFIALDKDQVEIITQIRTGFSMQAKSVTLCRA